jgi:hypothetical protein
VNEDVRPRLEQARLPFLDRYSGRDKIRADWQDRFENTDADGPSDRCSSKGDR